MSKTLCNAHKNKIARSAADIDTSKWIFAPPATNKHGAPRVDIKGNIRLQLPLSRVPFGVSHTTYVTFLHRLGLYFHFTATAQILILRIPLHSMTGGTKSQ